MTVRAAGKFYSRKFWALWVGLNGVYVHGPSGTPTTMVASTTRRQLRRCLNDIDFPASKDDLLAAADRHDCDNDTVRALRAIPAETYANATQVLASVTVTDDEIRDDQKAAARRSHTKPGRAEITKDLDTESPIVDELGENRGS